MRMAETPEEAPDPGSSTRSAVNDGYVRLDPRNVWRVGWVVIALVSAFLLLRFLIQDGGAVLFSLLMAWFASIAMEPVVRRLATRMRRGIATGIVMVAGAVAIAGFMLAFGQLFVDQVIELLTSLPGLIDSAIEWVNRQFNAELSVASILQQLNLEPAQIAQYGAQIVGGVLGLLMSVLGGFFSLFTFALFTFYFSADGPRLRRYVASLFPPRAQKMAVDVWDVTAQKTGGYVGARLVLAFINGSTSAIVFLIIGMPSWLALGIWTGIVAQFVPTIGTYIAIALPVLVGLLSDNPVIGVIALVWAIIYQQVENLTIEPRISARAVNVHPAVAFASVMLGAALFGVAGALLAIPVSAMAIALTETYRKRYDLRADLDDSPPATPEPEAV
jgi:predicted PurR-regulated permease PerM